MGRRGRGRRGEECCDPLCTGWWDGEDVGECDGCVGGGRFGEEAEGLSGVLPGVLAL